ncbi:short chain dehydrogenase [Echinicola strongylocentroti]|uniref:Short chain dehydrogenase n=1 Tax=Echinicola strongylocentroti TaxID=1795355 RepID=A0A2Z4INF4_9BACT|nr:short chain dehydrogenase [Echinicola strongylocentroti]AWW32364.1 short chain dehydrogenase [Echinicola strongylocentroti]
MKVLLIGGQGTIGKHIANKLDNHDEVLTVGRSSGDFQADMQDVNSLKDLFEKTGKVDAVVVTAGSAPVKPLRELSPEDFHAGIADKMMGQINVALAAFDQINPGGSITLTTGILAEDPIPNGTILSTVNNAVNGFVIGSYGELIQCNIRINAVSPALVEDSYEALGKYFPGHTPAKMGHVADAYV